MTIDGKNKEVLLRSLFLNEKEGYDALVDVFYMLEKDVKSQLESPQDKNDLLQINGECMMIARLTSLFEELKQIWEQDRTAGMNINQ